MNIIERNYLPKLDIKETQRAMLMIEKLLIKNLGEKINFVEVRQPIISSSRVAISSTKKFGNRQINFDSSNDNNVYHIYDDYKYWLINSIKKLDIKNNNSILTMVSYIDRDEEIKNTQSLEKRKLLIEYRYDSTDRDKVFEKALNLNNFIYDSLKKVQKEIVIQYPELKGGELPNSIDEKELKKIASRKNLSESLADVASDEGIFLLRDKRNHLKDRSISNTFTLSVHSYKKEIDEAYRLYLIQDRRTLEDIEPFISESETAMEEYLFGKEVLKNNNLRTINIEIDIDAISLLLLQKSHILELQSSNSIDELEKMLSEADINHL